MAGVRWPVALTFVAVAGIFGLFSPWGFFTGAVVFLPTIFNADPVYLRIQQSFQSWPAIPFLMVGTVSVLVWLSSRTSLAKRIGSVFLASWLSTAAVICASTLPRLQAEWLNLGPAASSTLQRAQRQIPAGAEVVAVDQVLGRFGARPFVYLLGAQWFNNGTIPLKRPVIYFVLAPNGRDDGGSAQQRLTAAVAFVQHLGATSILAQHDVYAFAWRVPDGQRSLSVPDGIS
jgi:hypothetical protein